MTNRARAVSGRGLLVQGVALADLTPGRFLNYVLDSRTHVITAGRHQRKRYRGHHAWDLLNRAGHFPPATPATLKEAIREPGLTPAELVARHDIASPAVRQVLTDYLTVRCAEMDYSSLCTLASHLAGLFWKQIETLAPGQRDLLLPAGLHEQWRETLRWRQDGKPVGCQKSAPSCDLRRGGLRPSGMMITRVFPSAQAPPGPRRLPSPSLKTYAPSSNRAA